MVPVPSQSSTSMVVVSRIRRHHPERAPGFAVGDLQTCDMTPDGRLYNR
jgi:hypothetical protein